MNEGNVWNHDNRDGNYNHQNNSGNRRNNQRNDNRSRSGNPNNREKNNLQVELLKELVQQNHTIIGLLRGIKHAVSENDVYSQPNSNERNNIPKKKNTRKNELPKKVEKSTDKKKVEGTSQPRKQFVMRFDDKQPLNKDLDETLSVAEETVEVNNKVLDEVFDENSVGEEDPFAFFGNVNEE